jgi:hypothetical protein
MQARYPEEGDSDEAREGNAVHWVGHQGLNAYKFGKGETSPYKYVGRTDPDGTVITSDMADGAAYYLSELMPIIERTDSRLRFQAEGRIQCQTIHPHNWGTCDFWAPPGLEPGALYLRDLKYGYKYVDCRTWQLVNYAIGVAEQIPGAQVFDLGVIQPRGWHRGGGHRSYRVSREQLMGPLRETIKASVEESLRDDARCISGPHCYECRALLRCDAAHAMFGEGFRFIGTNQPEEPTVDQLSGELRLVYAAEDLIKQRKAALETEVEQRIRRGEVFPLWQLGHGRGAHRKWYPAAIEKLKALEKLGGPKLFKEEPVSPAEAERRGVPAKLMAEYAFQPPGKVKLLPTDPNAAKEAFEK